MTHSIRWGRSCTRAANTTNIDGRPEQQPPRGARTRGRGRAQARGRARGRARAVAVERLEHRNLFAAVSWDGGGDGVNWTNNLNWSGNALPGPADDVTISLGGGGGGGANPTILVPSGTHTIRSLVSDEQIRTTGGTLAVTTTATASQPVTIASGGLSGGAWHFNNGAALFGTASGGQLHNVAITGGDVVLETSSALLLVSGTTSFPAASLRGSVSLQMAPGYVLNSLVIAEGASTSQRTVSLAQGGAGTVTIGPSGVIRLASGCGGNLTIHNSSTSTLVNNGTITNEAAGRTLFVQNSTFANNGTAQVIAAGATLNVGSSSWSNAAAGTLSAAGGTTLNCSGSWSNAGALSVSGATLDLGGTFATAGFNFAGFARTGGTVNLSGTLNNAGSTLTLDAATGTWNLLSGTINGGTVSQTGGSLLAPTANGGLLDNVAVTGADLILSAGSASLRVSGTTTFPAARLQGSSVNLQLAAGYVLSNPIIAEGAATGQRSVSLAQGGTGTVTVAPGTTIQLAPGCGGNLSLQNSSTSTLVNNGTITNDAAGRTLYVQNSTFTNNGVTRVTAGGGGGGGATLSVIASNWTNPAGGLISGASGSTVNFGGAWSNAGTLAINDATLNLGGTFATSGFNFAGFARTGGTVNLTGTLDNAGSTLTLDAAAGTWNFLNGTINGGTLDQTGGSLLALTASAGMLNNVAVLDDLLFEVQSAALIVSGTTSFPAARLRASSSNLQLAAGYVINSLVVAEGLSTGQRTVTLSHGGVGTITIAPSGVVRLDAACAGNLSLQNGSTSTLINNGLITNDGGAGRTLYLQNSTFTNNGTAQVTASGGSLNITATNWTNAAGTGAISAAAGTTLSLGGNWSNAGVLAVNDATLNLGGTWSTSGFNIIGFARSGGTVNLTGTLDNVGSTLILSTATGSWNLLSGTINGGTVLQTGGVGGSMLALTANGGTLNNVAIEGNDLLFEVHGAQVTVSGSTSFPAARLRASSADLRCVPGYTINSLVVAEGAATGQRIVSLAVGGAGDVTLAPTGEIRLAAGCGGNLSVQNSSPAILHNNGQIFAEAPGRTLYIQNTALTNAGTLFASAGTMAVTPGFTNTGGFGVGAGATITVGGAVINDSGAQFSTAGRLQIAGLLDIKVGSLAIAQPGGNARIRCKGLAIASNNLLQLNDNDLIVDYDAPQASPLGSWNGTAYTGILGMIATAYNYGAWDGPGISTALPAAQLGLTGIAADEAANVFAISGNQMANWEGDNVDATTVIIKYTYVGDANLDGLVDGADYGVIDNYVQFPGTTGYANGDFNFDGVIDGADYGLIDNSIQLQGLPL